MKRSFLAFAAVVVLGFCFSPSGHTKQAPSLSPCATTATPTNLPRFLSTVQMAGRVPSVSEAANTRIANRALSPLVDDTPFTGTCEKLKEFVDVQGVYGSTSNHPGFPSWTDPNFEREVSTKLRVTKGNCYLVSVHAEFTAKPVTSIITWVPSDWGCIKCRCVQESEAWKKRNQDYQDQQVSLYKTWAQKATDAWQNRTFKVCGKNFAIVRSSAAKLVLGKVYAELAKLEADWVLNQTRDLGPLRYPDCSKCGQCEPGQLPSDCSGCWECFEGACIRKDCGKITQNATGSKNPWCCAGKCCGFSKTTGQPLACCQKNGDFYACQNDDGTCP